MSSAIAKLNKDRSRVSKRPLAQKAKKVSSPKRKGKRIAVAPKPRKTSPIASSKARSQSKKVAPRKKVAKAASSKARPKASARASAPKRALSRKTVTRKRASARAPQEPPRPLSPGRIAAVRAFEQGLKQFNLHDFEGAKATFEDILERFADQPDMVAPGRTYLAICDQRLARVPSTPRNADALYDQGVFEFNRGRTREAIDILEKALKADPRADYVLYSLAIAYARHGDISKAIDALRRSISIRPVQRSHARHDPDFATLRTNREFQRLTGFGFEPPE